jgi:hypothetical protein
MTKVAAVFALDPRPSMASVLFMPPEILDVHALTDEAFAREHA